MRPFQRHLILFLLTGGALYALLEQFFTVGPTVCYLLSVNLSLFLLYAVDKLAARHSWTRSPELLLHVGALAGGSPLAFCAQIVFRHKLHKRRFQTIYRLIVLTQAALLGYCIIFFL